MPLDHNESRLHNLEITLLSREGGSFMKKKLGLMGPFQFAGLRMVAKWIVDDACWCVGGGVLIRNITEYHSSLGTG